MLGQKIESPWHRQGPKVDATIGIGLIDNNLHYYAIGDFTDAQLNISTNHPG